MGFGGFSFGSDPWGGMGPQNGGIPALGGFPFPIPGMPSSNGGGGPNLSDWGSWGSIIGNLASLAPLGLGIYNSLQGPPGYSMPQGGDLGAIQAMLAQQQAQQGQQRSQMAANAIHQQIPNIQSQVGGSVSPDYYAQVAATQTGYGDLSGSVGQNQAQGAFGLAPYQSWGSGGLGGQGYGLGGAWPGSTPGMFSGAGAAGFFPTGGQSSPIWQSLYGNSAFGGGPTALSDLFYPGSLWDKNSGFGNPAVNPIWGMGTTVFGSGCFTPDTEVKGLGRLGQYANGTMVTVTTRKGTQRPAEVIVHSYAGPIHSIGNGWGATPEHPFWHEGGWRPAGDIFPAHRPYSGSVWNLHVHTDEEDERNYQLETGDWVHNKDNIGGGPGGVMGGDADPGF